MAYTTIPKSTAYFDTLLWTGNSSSDSGTQDITGLNFQPDFMWNKTRGVAENYILTDVLRGTNSFLRSNSTGAAYNPTNCYQIPLANGFRAQGDEGGEFNYTNFTYATWNWKANGAGATNEAGSINTIKTSVSTTSGFSISQWVGTGSNATIGHGLGVTPKCFIVKKTSGTSAWSVYHESVGNTKFLNLNGTGEPTTGSTVWNNTSPTSSVFSVGTADNGNASGATYIGYFFAEIQGYSKFASYVGNGSNDGSFIYTGFKPAFVLIRGTELPAGVDWYIFDSKREGYNLNDTELQPNNSGIESTDQTSIDILSNGFKCRNSNGNTGGNGEPYIYLAFASEPLVSTNGNAATAR